MELCEIKVPGTKNRPICQVKTIIPITKPYKRAQTQGHPKSVVRAAVWSLNHWIFFLGNISRKNGMGFELKAPKILKFWRFQLEVIYTQINFKN